MNTIRRTVGAALLMAIVSTLAGCYAYVDDDYYHRHAYYRDYYYRDYPRYSYYDRYYNRW
jgi:hypothetical protein